MTMAVAPSGTSRGRSGLAATMMVLMALATTMMTAPILARILPPGTGGAGLYEGSGSATNR